MCTKVFLEWFRRLLDVLDRPSVIVVDNASYHNAVTDESKSPTMKDRKAVMQRWLSSHNIAFEARMTKVELYQVIKDNKPPVIYQTDVMAHAAGHMVLRTPPRQCQLNAIELIWARVKCQVAKQNTSMKLKDVKELTHAAIAQVSQADWHKVVQHTIKVEQNHWEIDGLTELIEPVIIQMDSDDSDDDSDSDNENGDDSDAHSD